MLTKPKAKKPAPKPKATKPKATKETEETKKATPEPKPKAPGEDTGEFEYLECVCCKKPQVVYAAYMTPAGPVALCCLECEDEWIEVRQMHAKQKS